MLLFICQVVSDSLWPHGVQHTSLSLTISQTLLYYWVERKMLQNHMYSRTQLGLVLACCCCLLCGIHCVWLEYLLFLPHFFKIIPPSFYFLKCCLFVEETVNSACCFIYLFLAVLVFVAAQTGLTGERRQRCRRGAWLPVVMASLVEQTLGRPGFSSCSGQAR